MSNLPYVTALYAAIIGLLAAYLTVNVIRNRVSRNIDDGDGGDAAMAMIIRAHSNIAQHAPLALLLILFAEASGSAKYMIHTMGVVLVVARLLSAWGLLTAPGPTVGRRAGAGLTVLTIAAASILILLRAGGMI